jgi:hypothetical protein
MKRILLSVFATLISFSAFADNLIVRKIDFAKNPNYQIIALPVNKLKEIDAKIVLLTNGPMYDDWHKLPLGGSSDFKKPIATMEQVESPEFSGNFSLRNSILYKTSGGDFAVVPNTDGLQEFWQSSIARNGLTKDAPIWFIQSGGIKSTSSDVACRNIMELPKSAVGIGAHDKELVFVADLSRTNRCKFGQALAANGVRENTVALYLDGGYPGETDAVPAPFIGTKYDDIPQALIMRNAPILAVFETAIETPDFTSEKTEPAAPKTFFEKFMAFFNHLGKSLRQFVIYLITQIL